MAEIKNLAKVAKGRMKNGFWSDYLESVDKTPDSCDARKSEVLRYYRIKAVRQLNGADDELFYYKVKNILDTYGDVSDIIGRLCDEELMKTMSFQEKQCYLFELSDRYRECRERYFEEKKFEKSDHSSNPRSS